MPKLLGDLEQAGLPLVQVKEAMASIGYASKRSTNSTGGSQETNHGEVRSVAVYRESPALSRDAHRWR